MVYGDGGFHEAASKDHHDEHKPDDENRDLLRNLFRFLI